MRRVLCVVVLLMLGGCSWYRRAHARHRDAGVATAADGRDHPLPPPDAFARGAHVAQVRGATDAEGRALAVGDRMPSETWVDVAPDGVLVLDWTVDTRAEVEGGSRVRLGAARPCELLLAHGAVRGLLAPGPNGLRAPLHVATPETAVEVPGDGDVYVAALGAAPRTVVFALGGEVELRSGALAEDGRPETRSVHAGEQAADGAPERGVSTIDAARAQVRDDLQVPPSGGRAPTLDAALPVLDRALADMEAEDRHRAELLATVPPPQGSDAARARVGELVATGQRLLRKRIALLAAWERAEAAAGSMPAEATAALALRSRRAAGVLGTAD